ncbi:hypothetical protein [Streptomyces phytophilus]|uniref:hypothetical protein n=1 Tax=Streptomyces phytophilus TaxID=722715 RepID=UPI0015F0C9EE|nr:hypothetical protein [Streptomyces phytophilus]
MALTYTRRGAHVLLLAPPAGTAHEENVGQPTREAVAAWVTAAEVLARLDRPARVDTLPARAGADSPTPRAAESGPRLRPALREMNADGRLAPTDSCPDPGGPPVGVSGDPDRDSLLITYVDPYRTDWARTVPWTKLLPPHGTLAVITHGDVAGKPRSETNRLLEQILEGGGLALVDRIALVTAPAARTSSLRAAPANAPQALTELLVLAPHPGSTTGSTRREEGR